MMGGRIADETSSLFALVESSSPEWHSPIDWSAVENAIGARFPRDYKKIVERFGRGMFQDYVRLLIPGDPSIGFGLEENIEHLHAVLPEFPEALSKPIGSSPKLDERKLMPWASTAEGDFFCWLMNDAEPEYWPVVAIEAGFWEYRLFSLSCSGLLLSMYRHPDPDWFPDDILQGSGPTFIPCTPSEKCD